MKIFLTVFFLLSTTYCFSQTEYNIWKKKELYQQSFIKEEGAKSSSLINNMVKLYQFTISEQDGNNCPFHPTCSSFLIQAVNQTNIFTGTLLFFDRFTRDMNIFKRHEFYPATHDGYLYDPPYFYKSYFKVSQYIHPDEILKK